jgi:hypothetical protein
MQAAAATLLPEEFALSNQDRAEILQFASWLLPNRDRADADAVTRLAGPLLTWADEATSKDDQRARMAAMRLQHHNTSALVREPVGPEKFLERAGVHYRFITGQTDTDQ